MSDELIIFGVLASILFHELTQISPGGIIVPGYIALLLDDPLRVAVTIALSLLTWGAVRLLSGYVILFGKRRFAVFIIVSFLLRFLTGLVTAEANLPVTAALVIGYLVPGILAQEIDRQGAVKTLSSMMIVAVALKLVFLAFMKSGYL
jgi:poly-gamma-glutamate biosynthesis protein PgsC/CapC